MSRNHAGVPHWCLCTEGGANLGPRTLGTPMYPRTKGLTDSGSTPFKSGVDLRPRRLRIDHFLIRINLARVYQNIYLASSQCMNCQRLQLVPAPLVALRANLAQAMAAMLYCCVQYPTTAGLVARVRLHTQKSTSLAFSTTPRRRWTWARSPTLKSLPFLKANEHWASKPSRLPHQPRKLNSLWFQPCAVIADAS